MARSSSRLSRNTSVPSGRDDERPPRLSHFLLRLNAPSPRWRPICAAGCGVVVAWVGSSCTHSGVAGGDGVPAPDITPDPRRASLWTGGAQGEPHASFARG